MKNSCVNCGLEIEFDTEVSDSDKYQTWDGMWRDTRGILVCDSDDAYVVEVGWPSRVYRMHDPVQQFLVMYHTTGGSMGEAIYEQERWLVGSRLKAIALKNAVNTACVAAGHDEFLLRIVPVGVNVVTSGPRGDWADVIGKFREDQYFDEENE